MFLDKKDKSTPEIFFEFGWLDRFSTLENLPMLNKMDYSAIQRILSLFNFMKFKLNSRE